jgi:predicted GNAT family N-acyltransferase
MTQVVALRTFEELLHTKSKSVHEPSAGADVYTGQKVTAQIKFVGQDEFSSIVNVRRLSPFGAEIDITSLVSNPDTKNKFSGNSELDVKIVIAQQICEFYGLVVQSSYVENGITLLGLRWCETIKNQTSVQIERRKNKRWLCGDEFLPTGMAPNPARFNDFIYFKVSDISKEGMQLATSLRNKLVIPGMIFESSISFPLVGQITINFKVLNARVKTGVDGKDFLSLGVQILSGDRITHETIGQYVLQFGPSVSISELKKSGFSVKSADKALDFGYVKTAEDYRSVLDLRKLAYSKVGKVGSEVTPESMGDVFDTQARIVKATHQGRLVGSLRIMFHSPDETTEYEEFLDFPPEFPSKADLVVSSRNCTDPNYRGSDLVYGLIRQLVLTTLQSGRRYILGGSSEELLPLYKKLGFEPTGVFFEHGTLNKVKEQLILGDVVKIISGQTTSIASWNRVYSDLHDYVVKYHDVETTPLTNLRLGIYKSLGIFSKFGSKG